MNNKFINLEETTKVYKIVKSVVGINYSTFASGPASLRYNLNEWTFPNSTLNKLGYKIFAFEELKYAEMLINNYSYREFKLFLAKTTKIYRELPPPPNSNKMSTQIRTENSIFDFCSCNFTWPDGTIMCEDLMLIKFISRGKSEY